MLISYPISPARWTLHLFQHTLLLCVAIITNSVNLLLDTVPGPRARSPAYVEVHSPPGTKQTTPQGYIFTACLSDCVYSNGLNWISGCEANLLIVFLIMPWAAPGGLPSKHSSRMPTVGSCRERCAPRAHLELPSSQQAILAHGTSLELVLNVNNWEYPALKANPCAVQT